MIIILCLFLSSLAHAEVLPIITIGHSTLRAQAQELTHPEILSPENQKLIDDMVQTMRKRSGVGLAAPQVNKSLRMFVMRSFPGVPLTIVINPKIEYLEAYGKIDSREGCLSIPGKSMVVKRFNKIHVTYYDRKGNFKSEEFKGFKAIIAQHEYDHLNGVLIVDLVEQMKTLMNYTGLTDAPLM